MKPQITKLPSLDYIFFTMPENRKWLMTGQGHFVNYEYEWRFTRRFLGAVLQLALPIFMLVGMFLFPRTSGENGQNVVIFLSLCNGVGIVICFALYPFRLHSRLRRLEREGQFIVGRVTLFQRVSMWDDWPQWRDSILEYRFDAPNGTPIAVRRRYHHAMLERQPQTGERIAVLYIDNRLHEPL